MQLVDGISDGPVHAVQAGDDQEDGPVGGIIEVAADQMLSFALEIIRKQAALRDWSGKLSQIVELGILE